jgi:hypothetical protein
MSYLKKNYTICTRNTVTAVDTWATVPGMYCYAARSILAITPRSNTKNLINALQRTNIKNNAVHFLFDCEASVPIPNASSVPA